jgi:hypothetical protein
MDIRRMCAGCLVLAISSASLPVFAFMVASWPLERGRLSPAVTGQSNAAIPDVHLYDLYGLQDGTWATAFRVTTPTVGPCTFEVGADTPVPVRAFSTIYGGDVFTRVIIAEVASRNAARPGGRSRCARTPTSPTAEYVFSTIARVRGQHRIFDAHRQIRTSRSTAGVASAPADGNASQPCRHGASKASRSAVTCP